MSSIDGGAHGALVLPLSVFDDLGNTPASDPTFGFLHFAEFLMVLSFAVVACPVPVQLLDEIRNAIAELQSATNLLVSQP